MGHLPRSKGLLPRKPNATCPTIKIKANVLVNYVLSVKGRARVLQGVMRGGIGQEEQSEKQT